jgi:hydroxymethylpyrimidine pyrophosphatase-like HAD family hydrolase
MDFLIKKGAFYNGAVAVDESLDYYGHWPMPAELVHTVTGYLADAEPDLQIAIQYKEDYHSFILPASDSDLVSWGFTRDELLPFSEACERECSKIVAWHSTKDMTHVYHDLIRQYSDKINIYLTDSRQCLQFVSSEATKENALLKLLSLRGIDSDDVVVFGDDMPDEGMFRTFGCSVAMANAKAALREIATHVTLSNDEDGVAFALEKILGII